MRLHEVWKPGTKIRRACWDSNAFWEVLDTYKYINFLGDTQIRLFPEHALADDWEHYVEPKTLGQVAFETWRGCWPAQPWHERPASSKEAWENVAKAVLDAAKERK